MTYRICLASLCLLILLGCQPTTDEHSPNVSEQALSNDWFGDSAERIVYAEQNWSREDSQWFYNTTQGSNLLPLTIFRHLEQADSVELFRNQRNMSRFRYITQNATADNPDGLPLGWVSNQYQEEEYVGLTCAACHTSQVNFNGTGIRIDGGAAMADMNTMLHELERALTATLHQDDKFARLQTAQTALPAEQLKTLLEQSRQTIQQYNVRNTSQNQGQNIAYGYARLDAFGRIYNRILSHLTPGQINANPPNAPVSYPFLWDTPQHDFVQWNGVGDNEGEGPLGRNTGEVLGVFATFDLAPKPHNHYPSSARIDNLVQLEKRLTELWSPSWVELAERNILPPIDSALAQQGQALYYQYECHSCHQNIERTSPGRRVTAQMSSLQHIGTDPQMALNALTYGGWGGYLEGELIDSTAPEQGVFG
ncbi:hypothetical protein KO507_02515, partial [Gilvimarinus agarilyticus]|uniref:di-heme-cytochrome C peroxidase n=1 Tax=Gilvimarinus sp. 2_MG-2023 TaxID=3062666 RepID=UPI0026E2BEEE